jgi:hypothetical protein
VDPAHALFLGTPRGGKTIALLAPLLRAAVAAEPAIPDEERTHA